MDQEQNNAQDEQMQNQNVEQAPEQSPSTEADAAIAEPQTSSRKRTIIVSIVAIVLILIGGGAYLLGANSSSDSDDGTVVSEQQEQEETPVEEPAATQVFNFVTAEFAYDLKEDGELERAYEARADEYIFAIANDRSAVYTEEVETKENNSTIRQRLVKVVGSERTTLVEYDDYTGIVTPSALSPDGTKIALFRSEEGFQYFVSTVDVNTGEVTDHYEMDYQLDRTTQEPPTLLSTTQWLNNTTLVGVESSCFECDGPTKPVAWTIDITTNELALLADFTDLADDNAYSTIAAIDTEAQKVFAVASTTPRFAGSGIQSEYENAEQLVMEISADGSTREVATLVGPIGFTGITSDRTALVAQRSEISEGQTTQLISPTPLLLNIETGSTSDIPIAISSLDSLFSNIYGTTFDSNTRTLYFAVTTFGETNDDETRTVLYSLPLSEQGESEVNTLFDMGHNINQYVRALSIDNL